VGLLQRRAAGLEYLELATAMLRQARLASADGGLWEAADVHWWWRRDQHPDPARQVFWLDGDRPVAAVIMTEWDGRFGCDLLSADHRVEGVLDVVWPVALGMLDAVGSAPVEMLVRDDDRALIDAVTAAGFVATGEADVTLWMDASSAPAEPAAPPGFALADRAAVADRPHHMRGRNGAQVAERLVECPLYDPHLDLAVFAPDAGVAGYGLFWADPVTGVGLVEPMRTEDAYQGMGLGRLVLSTGLRRLAARGCTRLKISYIVGNEPARRLYLGVGFRPDAGARTYRRQR
jgi:GNAT superfamily N-acetyltransferase